MATAAPRKDGTVFDFPCAVGGRNLKDLQIPIEDFFSAVLRTVFELCLEVADGDKGEASLLFSASLANAFDLDLQETRRGYKEGSVDRIIEKKIEEGMEDEIKDLVKGVLHKIRSGYGKSSGLIRKAKEDSDAETNAGPEAQPESST
jgi:hypothetical protein